MKYDSSSISDLFYEAQKDILRHFAMNDLEVDFRVKELINQLKIELMYVNGDRRYMYLM